MTHRVQARQSRGGVALIFVIAAITMISVLVTEMTFSTRTRFMTVGNNRDEAAAYHLAVSGANLCRLFLIISAQLGDRIDSVIQQLSAALPSGNTEGMSLPYELWELMPSIDTGMLRLAFVSDGDVDEEELEAYEQEGTVSDELAAESREEGSRFNNRNFLDFDGDFRVKIEGEDCKINVNLLAKRTEGQPLADNAIARLLYGMMTTEEADNFLRDRSIEPWDLIANLADWVDTDTNGSGPRGGYEDDLYQRQNPSYRAKNAPFDTLDEIRLVDGWQDEVFDKFAKDLSVNGSQKINVNCMSQDVQAAMIQAYLPSVTTGQLTEILQNMTEFRAYARYKKCSQVTNLIPGIDTTQLCSMLSFKTTVFTVRSTAQIRDASSTITTTVSYSDRTAQKKGGTVLYWRVD